MRVPLIIAFLVVFVTSAPARLWDTPSEIEKSYGKPERITTAPSGKCFIYRFKRFLVRVTFLEGKSQNERFIRDNMAALTPEETQQILSLNAREHTWRKSNSVFCLVPDAGGRAVAFAYHMTWEYEDRMIPMLTLETKDFADRFDFYGNPENPKNAK